MLSCQKRDCQPQLESLQDLNNDFFENEKLRNFKYNNNTAVNEFIRLASSHLRDQIVSKDKLNIFWSSMVDESTDICAIQ